MRNVIEHLTTRTPTVTTTALMSESRKETPSSVDPKQKKSSFDDDIGKEFFGSWKSLSVAGDDGMDFSFDTVSTGKKKSFNFDKMDLDINLDGDFDKLTSFKVDMPDLDFSSPSTKTAKSKESSKGKSSGGSHQGKHDTFNFSFDFNDELDDGFNFGSTLTERKKVSEKNSNIKDDGAAMSEQQGSKLNMAGCSEAFGDCQTDKLPASDNATAPAMESTIDCAGTLDASNIGELALTHEAQTSPQKSLSVSSEDEDQQIYLEEKVKSTEPVARDTKQILPEESFDHNDSTQATESEIETDTLAPEANTKSVAEENADRNIDVFRSDLDNSQLKISNPPYNNESGSNRDESEKADSETLPGNVIGTVPVQDDSDGEVTSATTLSRTSPHSDASEDIQKPTSTSEYVVDKVIPIKEHEPGVGSSKISQRYEEIEPQLCQPSSVGGKVSSGVNKGLTTSCPANEEREGISVSHAETLRKLNDGNLKSLSVELTKGEPAFLGSKNDAKNLCNIREDSNGDRIKNVSVLGTIPRHPNNKEATKGDSILLGSGMNNKDHNKFGGYVNPARSTDKATKSSTGMSIDSTTVVSKMISARNLKIGSSEGIKTMRRTPDVSSLKISRSAETISGNVNSGSSTDKATKSNTRTSVDSTPVVSNTTSVMNLKIGSSEGIKTRRTPDISKLHISSGNVDPASSTDKAIKSNTQTSVDSKTVGLSMISTRNLKIGPAAGLKTGWRTPDLSTLKIERNIGVSKDHSDATLRRESSSLRKPDTEVRSTASKIVHPIDRKISPIICLKRKTPDEISNANQVLLHPQKRLCQSPIESRNLKEPFERTVEVQCNQPENDTQTMLDNQLTSGLEMPNAKEHSTFLTMENDQNVEKAEGYAKELDDICNMLKKKHEEAKELLARAVVNNNYLLMLNHPKFDAKIQTVQKFAAELVSN